MSSLKRNSRKTSWYGVYILDEPSIGLHQRDNDRLINSLIALKDLGNSVLVVEHDKEIMLRADHLIDIGPFAGKNGGEIISQGTPNSILKEDTLTSKYLNNSLQIEIISPQIVNTVQTCKECMCILM